MGSDHLARLRAQGSRWGRRGVGTDRPGRGADHLGHPCNLSPSTPGLGRFPCKIGLGVADRAEDLHDAGQADYLEHPVH